MPVLHRRLAIAGVIAAAAITAPAAAMAAGPGSPAGKPTSPRPCATACGPTAKPTAQPGVTKTKAPQPSATVPGLSAQLLQAGLAAAKRDGGNTAAGIAAFTAVTGVSPATAQQVVRAEFGPQAGGGTARQPDFAAALASQLGVSASAARRALSQLDALSGRAGIDPSSPGFAAIARELGISSARLADALPAVKHSLAGR